MGYLDTIQGLDNSGIFGQVLGTLTGQSAIAGIEGQYFFLFMLEGSIDFLGDSGKIHSFTMEEKMGGDVPVFKLQFSTVNKNIVKHLHEGAKISCRFGRSMSESKSSELMIQSFNYNGGQDAIFLDVTISGFVQHSDTYLRTPKQKAYRFMSSKEAMIDAAQEHFLVVDRTESNTDDEQTWIRPNTPAIRFIFDTWKKSYISDNNFLMYGVNFHREFIITDLQTMIKKPIKWTLKSGYSGIEPNTASFDPNVSVSSDFGLMNQMTVYKKSIPVHSSVHGTSSKVETDDVKASYITGSANIKKDQSVKSEVLQISDHTNVHKNYHKAGLNNMTKSALQNSVELNINIENKWQDYELFDLIFYHPYSSNDNGFNTESETMGGVYAITRISRFYNGHRCATQITISRDGISGLEGSELFSFTPANIIGDVIKTFL